MPPKPQAQPTPPVKEQSVSLFELFYDLIYVYAVSSMTSILSEGDLSPYTFLRYLAASFIVLQSWMYMTNYINRFGRQEWYVNCAIAINMFSTVFLANAISAQWEYMYLPFNISLLVNLGTVFVLYALHIPEGNNKKAAALYSMQSLAPSLSIYALIALLGARLGAQTTFILDLAAILSGIFLPALIKTKFDTSIIGFPHLCERFELLVIITFGESIVTVGSFFSLYGFGLESTFMFAAILMLFGAYVVQVHNLIEHHAHHRALLLIYAHFFLVICLNLLTVAFNHVVEHHTTSPFAAYLSAAAVLGFFICLLALSPYYKEGTRLTKRALVTIAAALTIGLITVATAGASQVLLLVLGLTLASGGSFVTLLALDKKKSFEQS